MPAAAARDPYTTEQETPDGQRQHLPQLRPPHRRGFRLLPERLPQRIRRPGHAHGRRPGLPGRAGAGRGGPPARHARGAAHPGRPPADGHRRARAPGLPAGAGQQRLHQPGTRHARRDRAPVQRAGRGRQRRVAAAGHVLGRLLGLPRRPLRQALDVQLRGQGLSAGKAGGPPVKRAGDDGAIDATRRAIDAVWRLESAKIVAAAARLLRDVGLAEEVAQDALVAALEHWPRDGVPDNPAAWLMATAKHRALDHLRAWAMQARKHDEIARDDETLGRAVEPDFVDTLDARRADEIGDDLLRLIFTACHPVLPTDGRVALTLRLLGGLTTAEIARAFLLPEPTIAQRIVRAKRTLAAARVPFELPPAALRGERLASVLEVVYLVFNEGYTASAGADWMRPALADEALRLGRVLAALVPGEPEVLGLLALMEIQASRGPARTDAAGAPVLLADQDRSRWDAAQIARGLAALQQAEAQVFGAGGTPGPYLLQAAIAACHARAPRAEATDWPRIVGLYELLLQRQPSPVVALNHAVAVSMAAGPAAALPLVDALSGERLLQGYPWLPAVRGDLLARLGRAAEARAEFERAAAWTGNDRERALLLGRAAAIADAP
ncbi:MAG: hypothetical protein KIS83_07175 [Rubrivivax sp.]|nr:hypothetical protein [Rubrivivax sp.]